MIDEKKLIEEIQDHIEKEKAKCNQMVELGLKGSAVKYNHGEYCYVNALHLVQSQPKVGEWIPCSKEMPPKNVPVLTCDKTGWISVNINIHYAVKKNDFDCGYYVAWMPLPSAYRKDVE